jgi:Zn-dependent peptidase ImmA (M78 family)
MKKIDKKKTQLLEDFLSLGEKCNIKIIHDKGDFNGDNCLLFANNTIVINKHKPLDQRLHVLAKCFSQINLDNVYIKPVLRDLIEQVKTDKVYE